MKFPTFTCSICFREIDSEFSNNADPINDGRCCRKCDDEIVTPARIRLLERARAARSA